MIKVEVNPGVCGLQTRIKVKQTGGMRVRVEIESQCPNIEDLAAELNDVDAYRECFKTSDRSPILDLASRHCRHFGCPVPMALIKGIEAAVGVRKASDVHILFSEESDA